MKRIWKYVLVGFFFFWTSFYGHAARSTHSSDSCIFKVRGSIIDMETKEPIPFATVTIKDTPKGAVADEQGIFLLDTICGGDFTLVCSCVGYKSVSLHHDVFHMEPVIYMAPTASLLESVVVEGEAIVGDMKSISIESMDRSILDTKITSTLGSVVGDIQGVSFISTGSNVQLPVIHGLYGNRILLINNGVKHGFQNWGSDHAPEIDITSADNISVIKGASGVRYGPEALGGVVLVEGNPLNLSQKMYGGITSGYQTNGHGYHTNAYFACLSGVTEVHFLAFKQDFPFFRSIHTGKHVHQGRFPRAIVADQA
jgi:iron complex outermembrane receptor protein